MITLLPQAYAADTGAFERIMAPIISNIVIPIVTLLFAIGVLVFAYGVFEMIWKGGDADARSQGKRHMIGGLIGLLVMLSAWGLINLVSNTIKSF